MAQVIAFLACGSGSDCVSWITYNYGYLTQQPVYECLIDGEWTSDRMCTLKNICDPDSPVTDFRIDYSSPKSLHNWWQQLDLTCVPEHKY